MAEMLVKKGNSSWTEILTPEELAAAPEKLQAYLTRSLGGWIAEVDDDGFFAIESNPAGRGWRGDTYVLVLIPEATKAQTYATIKNKTKLITLANGDVLDCLDEVLDLTKLDPPTYWETGTYPVRAIYTTTLNKLKYIKVDYSKAIGLADGLLAAEVKNK